LTLLTQFQENLLDVILLFMPPFEEERAYCLAHIGWIVGRSVGL